jgi:hypothetical protein
MLYILPGLRAIQVIIETACTCVKDTIGGGWQGEHAFILPQKCCDAGDQRREQHLLLLYLHQHESCGLDRFNRASIQVTAARNPALERSQYVLYLSNRSVGAYMLDIPEGTVRPKHPAQLGYGSVNISDRAKDQSRDHCIEGGVREG